MRFFFVLGLGLEIFSFFYFFGTIIFPLQKALAFESQGINTGITLIIFGCGYCILVIDSYVEAIQKTFGMSKAKTK